MQFVCHGSSSTNRGLTNKNPFFFRLGHLLKPKMLVIIALLFCWNLRNSFAVALYHGGNGQSSPNSFPFYHHSPRQHSTHHRTISSNVRLRAPASLNQLVLDQAAGREGLTLSDETAIVGPLMIRSPSPAVSSSSAQLSSAMIPLDTDTEISEPRRKKDCGEPSIATRGLLGPTIKRSYFALSQDEVDQKVRDDEYRQRSERRKRDIQHQQLTKRNGGGMDIQDSPLPWTCETQYEWEDMGADHYPRFVRTAKCKTKLCFNGFFRCRPRRYKTKVLKRINPGDSTSCEDDDVSLPETLRSQWKFITVTINLCCDCTGRMPGAAEV